MKLVFATQNPNKLKEVKSMLPANMEIVSLDQIGCFDDIPETQPTLEGNALQKARYINQNYGINCFSDDTGLEIEALGGEPGVFSARYAGEAKDSNANMEKVLTLLNGVENRKARFRTVIALILDGKEMLFEGIVEGEIIEHKQGKEGFGYDPIFLPHGYEQTFAEMPLAEKNLISHRKRAFHKLSEYLTSIGRS
jgi:XTP/dITP diphosphohydrolase